MLCVRTHSKQGSILKRAGLSLDADKQMWGLTLQMRWDKFKHPILILFFTQYTNIHSIYV